MSTPVLWFALTLLGPTGQLAAESLQETEAVAAAQVEAARAEYRALRRDRGATAAQLWPASERLLERGLFDEGLELLDRLLRLEPDHASALQRLEGLEPRVQLELPLPRAPEVWSLEEEELTAAIGRTFGAAGPLPPVLREWAVLRLQGALHPDAVRGAARAQLLAPAPGSRAFAALVLRRLHPGTEVEPLLERSLLDPDREVRRQAALTLGALGDPEVTAPAIRALTARRSDLRQHGAEALEFMGYPEAIPALATTLLAPPGRAAPGGPRAHVFFGNQQAYVQDFDVEVATAASIADPIVGVLPTGAVLDVRVHGISSSPTPSKDPLRRALRRLAGVDFGRDQDRWAQWWQESPHNPANRAATDTPPAVTPGSDSSGPR
jgi:hypothetical protein